MTNTTTGLVNLIARQEHRHCPAAPLEDLLQAGWAGYLQARQDGSINNASKLIRNEIMKQVRFFRGFPASNTGIENLAYIEATTTGIIDADMLSRLSPREQTVITMFYHERQRIKVIALTLRISPRHTTRLKYNALKKIKFFYMK
jgi:DNA-directed RNA polymerase specialized sigma subunit